MIRRNIDEFINARNEINLYMKYREAKESFSKKLYTFFQEVLDLLREEGYDFGEPYSKAKYPKEYLSSEIIDIDGTKLALSMNYEKMNDDDYIINVDFLTYKRTSKYNTTRKLTPSFINFLIECTSKTLDKNIKTTVKEILHGIDMMSE